MFEVPDSGETAKSPTIAYEATYLQFMVQLPELSLKFRVVLGHASRTFEPFEPPRPVDLISCEAEQPCDEQLQCNGKVRSIEAQELRLTSSPTP